MPAKILLVDDDIDTLRLVGLLLQKQGYQVVAASNGHQALSMAQSEKPDLVLLDIMMPEIDGYEVCRRLRANSSTSSLPIIMFTAKSSVDDKVTGFEVGADDYLTKPTQPRELVAHIKAVLTRGGKVRLTATPPPGERGHVVGILAAKGGLGASILATNLGVIIQTQARKDVILAEYRPGVGSVSLDLGFTRPEGLNRLLQRRAADITSEDVKKELVEHSTGLRLLMSSYLPQDAHLMTAVDQFEAITNHLAYQADYLLLDLGPGLPPHTDKILGMCDGLIVVVEPVPNTLLRTKALIDILETRGFTDGKLKLALISRVRTEMQLSIHEVREQLGHDLTATFTPAPELTYQSAKFNVPVVLQEPDSLTTQQFKKLSEALLKHVLQKV